MFSSTLLFMVFTNLSLKENNNIMGNNIPTVTTEKVQTVPKLMYPEMMMTGPDGIKTN